MPSVIITIGTPLGDIPEAQIRDSALELTDRIARRIDRLLIQEGVEYVGTVDCLWEQPRWGESVLRRAEPLDVPPLQASWRPRRWRAWAQKPYSLAVPDAHAEHLRPGDELDLRWRGNHFEIHARCGAAVLVRHLLARAPDNYVRDRIRAALDSNLLRIAPGAMDFDRSEEWADALDTALGAMETALVGRYSDLAAEQELARRDVHLAIIDPETDRLHRVAAERFDEFDDAAMAYTKLQDRVAQLFHLRSEHSEAGALAQFQSFLGRRQVDERLR
jgi:hypothetical protein